MSFPRSSGILLHPTSLPGPYSIGDLGPEAFAFVEFLASSGQGFWQTLPLGPAGYGGSPYACYSTFAGNTLLISPEELIRTGLLNTSDLPVPLLTFAGRVDFAHALNFKTEMLRKAFDRFKQTTDTPLRSDFEHFKQQEVDWLDDYALFQSLKDAHGGKAWYEWDEELRRRQPAALERIAERLHNEIESHRFYQFLFFRQWLAVKAYANERGIKLIGDLPIFVAHDSADVWTHPHLFKLDQDGLPTVVAGVPPDYFSDTGQLWGNPLYNWETMAAEGFSWWVARVRQALRTSDALRFDHFRGFSACWEIPAGDVTAERGAWVETPGRELLKTIRDVLEDLPVIAEDLGVITPEVEALRDEFGFPGMRVLQFAFGGDSSNQYLPHNYHRNVVVYTGTHDNDTTVGWFTSLTEAESTGESEDLGGEREFCLRYLNTNGTEIHWDFIRAALASVGNLAIVPLQDVFGLGTDARLNFPNTTEGNWLWRYRKDDLHQQLAARLKDLTEVYGRSRKNNA